MEGELATAHQTWDRNWTQASERSRWSQAEPLVEALVPLLRERGFTRAIDVGCGIGRHALFLAHSGFQVSGVDASEVGLAQAIKRADEAGVSIDYRMASFYELPFENNSFDAAIAWNVLYHGDGEIARTAIAEIHRVLKPGALYVGTMLSSRNTGFGTGTQIRPGTFVVPDATDDKVHPHFYCDSRTLMQLHEGFEVLNLRDREQSPGAYHWEFTFERR
jgi:2-polyprenyl-3-methyl-5-hydroxy-6-metoxy-1,4-benzoquinol methylase